MFADNHQKHSELMDRTNNIGIDFLRTDVRAALTFIQIAETTHSEETRARNYQKALQGYKTVLRFLPRVVPTPEELADIEENMERVRFQLLQAGFL